MTFLSIIPLIYMMKTMWMKTEGCKKQVMKKFKMLFKQIPQSLRFLTYDRFT